jgi:hypothetical protein
MFGTAFLLGAVVVLALGGRFLESSGLALAVTAVIGGLYLAGALELLALRRATASLDRALAGLSGAAAGPVQVLNDWLIRVHPSLHQPVRQRLEGHRGPMPGPLMTPYLVSLLVMLGILGTFVGLLQTLSGVTLGLEGAADLEAIRRALTVPVGGLGLMFGTSIAGVAASAMLGLMSALSRRDRVLVTRRLDQEIGAGLRPFSLVHQRQETFRALQVQSECLPDIANQLLRVASQLERMGDRLGDQLLANQERFQDSVQGHYGELAASVDRSLRDSLARTDQMLANGSRLVGEAIQPILRDTLTAISAELSRTLQGTQEQLGRTMREQLQALGDGFAHTSAAVASAWREGLNAHQHANQALTEGLAASLVPRRIWAAVWRVAGFHRPHQRQLERASGGVLAGPGSGSSRPVCRSDPTGAAIQRAGPGAPAGPDRRSGPGHPGGGPGSAGRLGPAAVRDEPSVERL